MRNKKPIVLLTVLFFSSFAIIGTLAFLTRNTNDKKNGFTRRLLPAALPTRKQVQFPVVVNRLIGSQAGKLYFQGNNPYEIYTTNLFLDSFTILPLPIPPDKNLRTGTRLFMEGRHLYISCRNLPGILEYDLDSRQLNRHPIPYYYSKEVRVSKDQFIVQIHDRKTNDPIFVKLNLHAINVKQEDHFSARDGKSIFTMDGILYYDTTTHLACYTYFYQNGFICMDTNLNLQVKARTIDTITKREVKLARIGSSITMKQPPQKVNNIGTVADGKLYLESMLKADNELPLDFAENTVIDAYSVTNGNYIASFYIPSYKGYKPYQFNIIGKKLYAIFGKTVIIYDLGLI